MTGRRFSSANRIPEPRRGTPRPDLGASSGRQSLQLPLERRQRREHLARVPRPLHRVLLQHPADELAHCGRLRHLQPGRRARARQRLGVREGKLARQHLVEDHPQGEDVGALVLRRSARLLGRHVGTRSAVHLALAKGVGHSEVEHLHLAVVAEKDVPRREVPVNDAMRMGVSHGLGDLDPDPERLPQREDALCSPLGERAPSEQLQDEIGPLLAAPHVVQRDDVRVRQPRCRLRLVKQPLLPEVELRPGPQDLEGDVAPQFPVASLVDVAEAPAPNLSQELEAADDLSGMEGGERQAGLARRLGQLLEQGRHRPRLQARRRTAFATFASAHAHLLWKRIEAGPS